MKEYQIKNNELKDATESFEDVGHSMDARDMMKKYKIGVLAEKKVDKKITSEHVLFLFKFNNKFVFIKTNILLKDRTQTPKDGINFSFLVVPALILAAVGIAYQLFVNRA